MATPHYELDAHCKAILAEYREHLPEFEKAAEDVHASLKEVFAEAGLVVASIEHRVTRWTGKIPWTNARRTR